MLDLSGVTFADNQANHGSPAELSPLSNKDASQHCHTLKFHAKLCRFQKSTSNIAQPYEACDLSRFRQSQD